MAVVESGHKVLIIGAGVFGLAAALEVAGRGYPVTVIDRAPAPTPSAASNDVSRMVRMDYGGDRLYGRLAAEAIEGWHRWNARWGRDLYHEDGLLLLSSRDLGEGSYEGDSYRMLTDGGWPVQMLTSSDIAARFPMWNAEYYRDGYFNPRAGWAEAGAVISRLAQDAQTAGVTLRIGAVSSLRRDAGQVKGVVTEGGERIDADHVVVAAGVWTPRLLPELDGFLRLSGQPVLYFQPDDPEPFRAGRFPPWGADLAASGWYGFPADHHGLVKIGSHGPGYDASPDAPRVLPGGQDEAHCRDFLAQSLPELANAPLAASKMCIYTDTWDGNFLIGPHPGLEGLTVATGGSGHAFKFGPVLGGLIADALQGVSNPYTDRFAWRPIGESATEAARYMG